MATTKTTRAQATRDAKDAARASKKAAAVVASRDANVGTLINKAGQAAQSMVDLCREAAILAAKQLNPAKPLQERIAEVMSLYAADFAAAGHNVKAVFGDVLLLQALANNPVVVAVVAEGGKKVDKQMTAAEAATCSKHALRDAAKQVREQAGIGRKVTPRAPKTTAEAASSKVAQPATVAASDVDKFTDWLDMMPEYITDAVYRPRIDARLIELGYRLEKAAKGRVVVGKAGALAAS